MSLSLYAKTLLGPQSFERASSKNVLLACDNLKTDSTLLSCSISLISIMTTPFLPILEVHIPHYMLKFSY